jgi:hypothetical protein
VNKYEKFDQMIDQVIDRGEPDFLRYAAIAFWVQLRHEIGEAEDRGKNFINISKVLEGFEYAYSQAEKRFSK